MYHGGIGAVAMRGYLLAAVVLIFGQDVSAIPRFAHLGVLRVH